TILNRIIRGYLNRADKESNEDVQPSQESTPDSSAEPVANSPEQAPDEVVNSDATQAGTVAPESIKEADDEEDQLERNSNKSGKSSKRNNRILREAKESMGTPYVEEQEAETQSLSKEAM